jgi:hypothetical protein
VTDLVPNNNWNVRFGRIELSKGHTLQAYLYSLFGDCATCASAVGVDRGHSGVHNRRMCVCNATSTHAPTHIRTYAPARPKTLTNALFTCVHRLPTVGTLLEPDGVAQPIVRPEALCCGILPRDGNRHHWDFQSGQKHRHRGQRRRRGNGGGGSRLQVHARISRVRRLSRCRMTRRWAPTRRWPPARASCPCPRRGSAPRRLGGARHRARRRRCRKKVPP